METGSCVYPPEYSDADWYRKDIKYAVDKSLEFSEVLFTSDGDVNIYGNGERLYTKNGMNKTTYINGLNNSVYETVDMKFDFYGCRETSKEYSYTDTGYSKQHKFGYGYNGEALDDTGLIYLRARYYNPRIGQFIQLDTYQGEQDSIESQNRYAYTMNNPYKYVDVGGNKAIKLKMNPSKLIGKVVNKNTNKTKPIVSTLTGKTISGTVVNYLKEKQEEREKERIRQQFINAGIPADHPDLNFGVDLAYSIKKLCTLLFKPKINDVRSQGEALLESYEWYKSNYKTIIDGVNGIGKGIGELSDYINKRNNDSNVNDDLYGSKPLLYGATERVGTMYSACVRKTKAKEITSPHIIQQQQTL